MSAVVVPFPVRGDDRQEPLCATRDPAWWFEPELFPRAIEVCSRCAMRSACLAEALQSGERLGVWGGLTPEQRADLPAADVIVLRPERGRR
jgi:hypothetical protein